MMLLQAYCIPLVAIVPLALGQFLGSTPDPDDFTDAMGSANVPIRYKAVPTGICELDPDVKSYSGYADVGSDQHVFFWFFEARTGDASDAPLTVYFDGGPGVSSMLGLFQNHGPCTINEDGQVENNRYSWNTVSNMLYIDQPVQVGLSYTNPGPAYINITSEKITHLSDDNCPDYVDGSEDLQCGTFSNPEHGTTTGSTESAAPSFWKTLQGFIGVFPEYAQNGVHLTSESYGGHYGPVFSAYINSQNSNLPDNATAIKLKSLQVGNGWFDPITQFPSYYNFSVSPGNTYDYFPYENDTDTAEQIRSDLYGPRGCLERLRDCATEGDDETCSDADAFCSEHVEAPLSDVANRNEDDIRQPLSDAAKHPPNFYADYLNTERVQKAIGAFTNYTDTSTKVGDAFGNTGDDARSLDIIPTLQDLLANDTYIVLFNGDADYTCNWIGVQSVADDLIRAPGYSEAKYANISTSDGQVNGVVKQAGNFAFLRIYYAGHQAPYYQPELALAMFNRTINGLDIETGTKGVKVGGGYASEGTDESEFREGNGTVNFGTS